MVPKQSREVHARVYLACVVLLAVVAVTVWATRFGFSPSPATLALGLGLGLLCAAERAFPVSFGVGKASFEFGGAPIFFALVLGGPLCALVAALPSAAYRDPSRAAFQGAVHVVQVLAGSLVFLLLSPDPSLALPTSAPIAGFVSWGSLVLGTLAAGFVFFGLDALIGPTLMRLKYGLSWRAVFTDIVLPALPSDALAVVTVLAAVPLATFSGPTSALVLLGGTFLSLLAVTRLREHRKKTLRLERENAALKDALRTSNTEFASRLIGRLGSRDGYTAVHAAAAAVYAYDLAKELGLAEDRAREVRLAALLMDVGLLWVSDEVLLTHPDRLNSVGKMSLEEHPKASEEVLLDVPGFGQAARWVRWHHERPDGTGYPDRLPGGWIPTEAKILAASSFYASLVLDGPYTRGASAHDARRALIRGRGESVDEDVAKALLRVLDDKGCDYARAKDARFSFSARDLAANTTSPT